MSTDRPILYSFRRCPYAMRARLALHVAGIGVEHREILLRDKPQELLDASPKGSVPVLVLPDGTVIDESLDVMRWALARNDPEDWLAPGAQMDAVIADCDGPFKHHLDRYKYASRHAGADALDHRDRAARILAGWDEGLRGKGQLLGARTSLADVAVFPFVRQFAMTDRDWFDAQAWPALIAWLDAHLASDRFAAIMVKHPVWTGDGRTPDQAG